MRKLNVAILAGGRSSEHDISRLSAAGIIAALDPEKYNPVAVL
ncbi:MAG: D-ala D-ala ligase N-terminus, partial [Thermoleophilia bacterium]|nr:D-ala D-ala ligase N-terminus [Thermoleophilia bacterium]